MANPASQRETGRQDHWLPHLQGPWLRPTVRTGRLKAGRLPKLPG